VLFLHVSPGGALEATALVQYARNPGTARTGREAKDMLEEWRTARKRLKVVGMPDLAPMEKVNAMIGIVQRVIQADPTLNHRFSILRYGTAARAPTEEDAVKMERFLVSELNLIESNERVEEGMKESTWHLQEVPGAQRQINAITPGNQPAPPAKEGICKNFIRGKCNYGSRCRYVHDEKAREQRAKEISKLQHRKETPCRFFASAKGCLKGDRCEYLHEKNLEECRTPNRRRR